MFSWLLEENVTFQLTTSHGGRLVPGTSYKAINTFQLTTSHGGRPFSSSASYCRTPFNSRPHTEVDVSPLCGVGKHVVFQLTTSHGGRHAGIQWSAVSDGLSTHDLTRRSTSVFPSLYLLTCLSTHDLTRRSTAWGYHGKARGVFQLTTSHGGRRTRPLWPDLRRCLSTHDLTRRSTSGLKLVSCIHLSFNSRPHTEVDVQNRICNEYNTLSTHDLTRRSTLTFLSPRLSIESFQLTTSHGGRPIRSQYIFCRSSFNSRPHTEVDLTCVEVVNVSGIFQLTTSHGGRR